MSHRIFFRDAEGYSHAGTCTRTISEDCEKFGRDVAVNWDFDLEEECLFHRINLPTLDPVFHNHIHVKELSVNKMVLF